jgi:hypothetical protein
MSVRPTWLPAAVLAVSLAGTTAFACDTCKQTPCVLAQPAPQFKCVTEMVPVTVMKTKTTVDLVPVCTKTVMKTKIDIVYDEQTTNLCKKVVDTVFEDRAVTVCRPICETTMVCQSYRVCRPVTTTRCVTDYRLEVATEAVPTNAKCGHPPGGCSCKTAVRICTRRVPVVREVTETHYVTEVETQMVPVVQWRTVTEQTLQKVPVTTCRTVNEVVRVRVPRLVFRSEPKTVVYKTAVLSCAEIPVTVYRPVMRIVPVVEASGQLMPSSQEGSGLTEPAPDH